MDVKGYMAKTAEEGSQIQRTVSFISAQLEQLRLKIQVLSPSDEIARPSQNSECCRPVLEINLGGSALGARHTEGDRSFRVTIGRFARLRHFWFPFDHPHNADH